MAPWKQKFRDFPNWFCVKQPDGENVGRSNIDHWETSRMEEMDFFQEHWQEEWDDPLLRKRLGTKNIQNYLVQRLLQWNLDL
jgi:hypothetical protein